MHVCFAREMIAVMENFSKNLRAALAVRGKRQVELARAINVTEATISRYLSGRVPDDATIKRIADVLDIEPSELTGDAPLMTDQERDFLRTIRRLPDGMRDAIFNMAKQFEATQPPLGLSDQERQEIDGLPSRKEK